MSHSAEAIIDLAALRHNAQRVRSIIGSRMFLAMIKANGYGHGLVRVAKALLDADALGVASFEEAQALRLEGILKPIFVMSGFKTVDELLSMVALDVVPVIHHVSQVEILEKTPLPAPLTAWVKIDTGMHRLGFLLGEAPQILTRLNAVDALVKPIGLMTHLADADNADQTFTLQQIKAFQVFSDQYPDAQKSLCNSAGILAQTASLHTLARPGIMLYGVSPFSDKTGEAFDLQPVMTMQSKLIAIKALKKGDLIGYGCTWACPEDMPVGVVSIGYGDGYPRHATNGTPVLIHGVRCPLVGRVSMDLMTLDLRPVHNAAVGDVVTLWGQGLPVEDIAACARTIPYELLCNVTQRVSFIEQDVEREEITH